MKRAGRVAILAPHNDPQALAVQGEVRRLGENAEIVDVGGLIHGAPWSTSVRAGKAVTTLDRHRLDSLRAVYVRQVPGPFPPLGRNARGRQVVLSGWVAPFMMAKEREAVAQGLLMELHARGVALLNPPSGGTLAQNKPFQLMRAAALGIPVPRTLITNAPDEAYAFIRAVRRAIAKPVHGGALTVALDAGMLRKRDVRQQLGRIRSAPVILQERVDGDDVRVMLLDGRVISSLAVRLPEGPVLDFRGSEAYQGGKATYERVTLPAAVQRQAARWARECGLIFAGLDAKRTARGKMVFLECNSSPIYLDGELKSGDAISAAVARWLVNRAT
ncbi:MAG: hypothetical protein AB2A00_19600 [Myxococcota bacterium]